MGSHRYNDLVERKRYECGQVRPLVNLSSKYDANAVAIVAATVLAFVAGIIVGLLAHALRLVLL
jgi:hypothetical protein